MLSHLHHCFIVYKDREDFPFLVFKQRLVGGRAAIRPSPNTSVAGLQEIGEGVARSRLSCFVRQL